MASICASAREFVPHDEPTIAPPSMVFPEIPTANPQEMVVAPVLTAELASSIPAVASETPKASVEHGLAIVVPHVFPAEKVRMVSFDEEMFWFWPVDKARANDLRVPVLPPQSVGDSAKIVVPSIWEIPLAIGSASGVDFSATRMEMVEMNGIPVISIFPESQVGETRIPVAMAFPVVTESGESVVCVVYRLADKYEHMIVAVTETHLATPAVGLGRFERYGRFQYPSIMWKLQDMGGAAERRGDTKSADLIYAEFIKAFDEYVRRMED